MKLSPQENDPQGCCPEGGCAPPTSIARRHFLQLAGVASVGMLGVPCIAGPFDEKVDPNNPIPLDKKLDPAWVKSLYERGRPTVFYRGWKEQRFVGLPIGGIGSGTVYLGGDGRLWCWDIFNEHHEGCIPNEVTSVPRLVVRGGQRISERHGANYVRPTAKQWSPWSLQQGFVLKTGEGSSVQKRELNGSGFAGITFTGQYPIGSVSYWDGENPIEVDLEAFSPFIPLDLERSSYPATILRYTIRNTSSVPQQASIIGYLENPGIRIPSEHKNAERILKRIEGGFVGTISKKGGEKGGASRRDDIVIADFEWEDWRNWTAEGDAMAGGPFPQSLLRPVQDSSGFAGDKFVNTYNTRTGKNANADARTGTLTSPPFKLSRKYINLLIGGGKHRDAYVEVVVDGRSAGKVTGGGDNKLRPASIDVGAHEGKQAQIRIVDHSSEAWAQITVDQIVASDERRSDIYALESLPDFGSVALVAVSPDASTVGLWDERAKSVVQPAWNSSDSVADSITARQIGAVEIDCRLGPNESREFVFVLAWHFPNTHFKDRTRHYANVFPDAGAVAQHVARNVDELTRETRMWRDVWYGGTLPHWLLERTLVTADTLQTNNVYRFEDGEFWAWEGIGCCPGTCTHVWHYAQTVGRLFPQLERDLRERTDFGRAFRTRDGAIDFRGGQAGGRDATDGQAGVILRTYREHQMSTDGAFLKRVWPRCKKALEFLISQDARDGEPDGIPVGAQHNTLDAEWFGKVPAIASLYLAALRAGGEMAKAVDDHDAARRFGAIYGRGRENISSLYRSDFGFFVQEEDVNHLDAIGIGNGCYIDQVIGQWWAFNVGLGRLFDGEKIRSALNALWDYNFCPDVGRLRASITDPNLRGRAYALEGDAGLVMCTWPKGGRREDWQRYWQYGYFNECMTGFEYQVAAHMIWESKWEPSLLEKGLAITRAVHDRYSPSLRNPYNEIECSDHYARAMASYGVFLAVCGFEYDGPTGHLGYAPRLQANDFKAAFTAAAGWGTIAQQRLAGRQAQEVEVFWGEVDVETLRFECDVDHRPSRITVQVDEELIEANFTLDGPSVLVRLRRRIKVSAGQSIHVDIH